MAFYDTWDALFGGEISLKFEDSFGDVNAFDNSGAAAANLPDVGTFVSGDFRQAGPVTDFAGTDYSVAFSGSNSGRRTTGSMQQTNQATGTFAVAFKADAADSGRSMLWGQGTTFRVARMEFSLNASGFFEIFLRHDDSGSDEATWTGNVDLRDEQWHLVIIRQKNDGTGMEIYIDTDVVGSLSRADGAGFTGDDNSWMQYVATTSAGTERQYCADNGFTGGDHFDGNLALIGLDPTPISDADITILMAGGLWSAINFANKTIRRQGRKLFFDYTTL